MWKMLLALLINATLGTLTANAARIIVKDNLGFEQIPEHAERRIVGTWLLHETHCTRSIEEINERYFMVSRCKGKHADSGLPLQKINAQLYTGKTTNWSYEIADSGELKMRSASGRELIATPSSHLWP